MCSIHLQLAFMGSEASRGLAHGCLCKHFLYPTSCFPSTSHARGSVPLLSPNILQKPLALLNNLPPPTPAPARLRAKLHQPNAAPKFLETCPKKRFTHPFRSGYHHVHSGFAGDPALLSLRKGRCAFSHLLLHVPSALLSPFLPPAVISSSLAAEGGGRASARRGRWLIFPSSCARGWQSAGTVKSSSTFSLCVRGRKHHCAHPAPWGALLRVVCVCGELDVHRFLQKMGAALAGTPTRTHRAEAGCSQGVPFPCWDTTQVCKGGDK